MQGVQLPLYQSHKQVRAALITEISTAGNTISLSISFPMQKTALITFSQTELEHKPVPEVGMYLIEYDDNYFSFSPANKFIDGYTKVEE